MIYKIIKSLKFGEKADTTYVITDGTALRQEDVTSNYANTNSSPINGIGVSKAIAYVVDMFRNYYTKAELSGMFYDKNDINTLLKGYEPISPEKDRLEEALLSLKTYIEQHTPV